MPTINNEGKVCWLIPANIDLVAILQRHPPIDFRPIIDHFYFILDYIYSQIEFIDLDETIGYVNVNAQVLQKYNRNYNWYLQYLTNRRILISDNRFVLGKKSTGYMFVSEFITPQTQLLPATWWTLRQKVKKETLRADLKTTQIRKEHFYLWKWFDCNLNIDKDRAIEEVENVYPLPKMSGGIRGLKRGAPNPRVQRLKAFKAIQRLHKKDYYFIRDENVGRCHTNLTNLKKELRSFVTYSGQTLINIDIANSQPLLSALLLDPDFYTGKSTLSINNIQSVKALFQNFNKYQKTIQDAANYITLVLSSESKSSTAFVNFTELVESGQFYQYAFSKMFPKRDFNKSVIKTAIFQTFFSANQFIGQKEAAPKKAFSETFPEVYSVFRILKRSNSVVLSHLLQRIESFLMIDCIAKRIGDEKPELPVFTIHDSILTLEGNQHYIADVIKDEIKHWTGLSVTVKFE